MYETIWKALKLNIVYWAHKTDEDKETNEKKLYADLLEFMKALEEGKI